jgi:integrase
MLPPTLNIQVKGDLCMVGGIYSDEHCPICDGPFQDNGKDALACKDHPEQKATKFKVKFGRKICRRFARDYFAAQRFLTGLRYKKDEGTLDVRDYRKDNPLGFENLAEKWLEVKKQDVKPKTYNNLSNYMGRATRAWGNKNIKEIGYAEIEDLLLSQSVQKGEGTISDKTKANMRSCLHHFWVWLRKRRILRPDQMPEFPEVSFELGFRQTIDKETQERILGKIHEMTFSFNPKIWLGIKWLCTYISIRPGEMSGLKEKHIDLKNGYLIIPSPKEKRPKLVPILDEDIAVIESMVRGFPEMPFFRHVKGIKGCAENKPFGEKYFYKWWVKACANLGIEGVDLYGGTRHSSAIALRKYRTPEEIKRATMHSTNKAFERYFRIESDDLRGIYEDTREKDKPEGKTIKFPK